MAFIKATYDVKATRLNADEVRGMYQPYKSDPYKRYESPTLHIDGIDLYDVVVSSRAKGKNDAEVTITCGSAFTVPDELLDTLKKLAEKHSGMYVSKRADRKANRKRVIEFVEGTNIYVGGFEPA